MLFGNARFARMLGPEEATGCSYGWSVARARPRDAEPVETVPFSSLRPDGAEECGDDDHPALLVGCLRRPFGADFLIQTTYPRVPLRTTRGYKPLPRWGK